jgi:hypothetical protein
MLRDDTYLEQEGFIGNAQHCLFRRWRDGVDLQFLIELLASEVAKDRHRGAYYLGEALPCDEALIASTTKLADDALPYCRMMFVIYVLDCGLYNEEIAVGLANGLFDFNIKVRVATINWAIYATDDRFDYFAQLVEYGLGAMDSEYWQEPELKRALRGLSIARRLRDGESVDEIRKGTPEEDSYTFDYFELFKNRTKRYIERRQKHDQRRQSAT